MKHARHERTAAALSSGQYSKRDRRFARRHAAKVLATPAGRAALKAEREAPPPDPITLLPEARQRDLAMDPAALLREVCQSVAARKAQHRALVDRLEVDSRLRHIILPGEATP